MKELLRHLGVSARTDFETRYNIAPGSDILVVREAQESKQIEMAEQRWGFMPAWKDGDDAAGFVNAQAETIAEKPSFRDAFRQRRCLVPASGFYEWAKEGKARKPWLFRLTGDAPFFLAGIWEKGGRPDRPDTCAVITTAPNRLMQPIHHRMPAIIEARSAQVWLDSRSPLRQLHELLVPFSAEGMTACALDGRVNAVGNDDADCLKPASVVSERQGLFEL
jgi:putative SOS response-associated peptidase YedK